jgi:hypothetical protein
MRRDRPPKIIMLTDQNGGYARASERMPQIAVCLVTEHLTA